jgi:hypothetical protein
MYAFEKIYLFSNVTYKEILTYSFMTDKYNIRVSVIGFVTTHFLTLP